MKVQISKSEMILLKELINSRNKFNHINVTKLEKEDPNYDKHQDHFSKESELLSSIFLKLECKECELNKCHSDLSANFLVFDDAKNEILICETCAEILELKERDQLPKNLVNLDLYYHDMKI